MDDDDLNDLRRRFGESIDDWPAPYRAAARDHLASASNPDAVLRAALARPTDEAALSRAVLTRLAAPRPRRLAPQALLGAYAALLIVFGVTGYGGADALLSDPLVSLALGQNLSDLAGLQ